MIQGSEVTIGARTAVCYSPLGGLLGCIPVVSTLTRQDKKNSKNIFYLLLFFLT